MQRKKDKPENDDFESLLGAMISPNALPIISIAPYLSSRSEYSQSNQAERLKTSQAIHTACRDFGFFYLDISSFATQDETDELAQLAQQFFALPQNVKDDISIDKQDLARGYQRLNQNLTQGKPDSHEGLDLYAPVATPDPRRPLWGTNQWPSQAHVPGFQETYEKWVEKMKRLGLIVMEAMAVGLGLSEDEWLDLRSKVDDSFWVLRVIGYPPLAENHDGFSCGAHKDYGCLTFLYADPTPSALQVFRQTTSSVVGEQDSSSGEWINANPIPNCIVCNIGEMWEVWSNGLYKSTLHRVIHRGSNYRVSVPFFFEPNFDALVEPLPAAIRMQAPSSKPESTTGADKDILRTRQKLYEPVVYGQFLLNKVGSNFDVGKGKYD